MMNKMKNLWSKKRQWIILIGIFLLFNIAIMPISCAVLNEDGSFDDILAPKGTFINYRAYPATESGRYEGFFTANGTVDILVADFEDASDYIAYGIIPPGAVWSNSTNGCSFNVTCTSETDSLIIGNPSTTKWISYHLEYNVFDMPGLGSTYLILLVLSIFGLLLLQWMRLNNKKKQPEMLL